MSEPVPLSGHTFWLITPEPGGGEPRRALVIVAEPDPVEAEHIIKQQLQLHPGEQIEGPYPQVRGSIEALGLKPKEVVFWTRKAV